MWRERLFLAEFHQRCDFLSQIGTFRRRKKKKLNDNLKKKKKNPQKKTNEYKCFRLSDALVVLIQESVLYV